jgi:CRISPR system Cascade subunit CasE
MFHRLVWELFADRPDRRRDFLYRVETGRGERTPVVYTVSARPPEGDNGLWEIATKPYRPQVAKGERLIFSLRANPVVSRRDEKGRQHRHDVVMDAKWRLRREGKPIPPLAQLVREAAGRWLQERAAKAGFRVEEEHLWADGYRQHRWMRHGRQVVSISTVDFNGILEVRDPEVFRRTLFKGIGPAKGFGNGLLMVRRV